MFLLFYLIFTTSTLFCGQANSGVFHQELDSHWADRVKSKSNNGRGPCKGAAQVSCMGCFNNGYRKKIAYPCQTAQLKGRITLWVSAQFLTKVFLPFKKVVTTNQRFP